MLNIRTKIMNSLAVILLLFVAITSPVTVSAASNSLGVNPRRDYSIRSGDKVSDTLTITNLNQTEALSVNVQLIDFGAQDQTGSPKLLLGRTEPTRWSLKPYLTIANNVQVAAGKSIDIPFTISIPAKLGAGSYYGAIKYSTTGEEANNNVSLTSSSATLVFVRVPGEAQDAMLLDKFGPFTPNADAKNGVFGKLYVGSAPKYLSYRLINKGNVAEQPTGSIALKNAFGKKVKTFENANPNSNIVLIDQTRRIDLCINEQKVTTNDKASGREVEETKCNDSKLAPGRYTAQLGLLYGDNGSSSHELRSQVSFWYLPLWFIVAVLVGILLVIGLIWLLVRSFGSRRYSRGRR